MGKTMNASDLMKRSFSVGKKVERCQGNRSIHALIPDARS